MDTASLLQNPTAQPPIEQPPESPCVAPSLSSNSSDSEIGTSPSFDERIKNLDDMFEMWSGNVPPKTATLSEASTPTSATSVSSRPKFPELDVIDVKPSDILKSVLSKKSIFDDDFKRLENIGEKYEPKDFVNLNRSTTTTTVAAVAAKAATPTAATTNNTKPSTATACSSQLPKLQSLPPQQTAPTPTFTAQISQALPRLNAVSPMNSPQPQSPYNSPSPSPIVTTPNMSTAKMSNSVPTVQPVKGLQYPFPTHPPISSSVTNLPNVPSTNKTAENTSTSQDDSSKSKSHSSGGKNATSQEKNSQTSNGSKSSNINRTLNKSASVPGSNHSGTVRTTLTSSCSLNINIKEESSDSVENVIPTRKTSREEKNSNSKNEHTKKTEMLDRRKWESISSENSDPASSSEILSERTENERVGRERHESTKEIGKNKNKSRNQSEIESQERDEPRIKYELESKKSDEYEYRRRELESDDAVHNWKSDYNKPMQNPQKDREHVVTVNHFTKSDKHNKENTAKSRESTPMDRQQYVDEMNKNASKNSRSNSPAKGVPKRRLSSHESIDSDDGKRFKFNADITKSMERHDFKDPNGRTGEKQSKHQRNFNKINNVHKTHEDSSCDMDDRPKKETGFDERRKERDPEKHRSKSEKSSSHRSRRSRDEKSSNPFREYTFYVLCVILGHRFLVLQ